MSNQNGRVYGLTLLCPILNDVHASPSHDLQIRAYLAALPTGAESPFAIASGTHLARLVVMDDVIYVGAPAHEEHLHSKYLIFEANIDAIGDAGLDSYLTGLANLASQHLDAIWKHCTGYPGTSNLPDFLSYMKACRIETTFFFAATNDKSVPETLTALQTQRAMADFIVKHQGMAAAELQRRFIDFASKLSTAPVPPPAMATHRRDIQTGGRNE
ncbi:hypothetical protein [Acidicapsa ligni]|uniref:hypothetical protein n=1 Tax=Acidicapsa ligni TaxID=542300 RepID=UPI0021E04264|nr:hypothetical protein [Acidicapsa ligni]